VTTCAAARVFAMSQTRSRIVHSKKPENRREIEDLRCTKASFGSAEDFRRIDCLQGFSNSARHHNSMEKRYCDDAHIAGAQPDAGHQDRIPEPEAEHRRPTTQDQDPNPHLSF
jgi:hypothetical protein